MIARLVLSSMARPRHRLASGEYARCALALRRSSALGSYKKDAPTLPLQVLHDDDARRLTRTDPANPLAVEKAGEGPADSGRRRSAHGLAQDVVSLVAGVGVHPAGARGIHGHEPGARGGREAKAGVLAVGSSGFDASLLGDSVPKSETVVGNLEDDIELVVVGVCKAKSTAVGNVVDVASLTMSEAVVVLDAFDVRCRNENKVAIPTGEVGDKTEGRRIEEGASVEGESVDGGAARGLLESHGDAAIGAGDTPWLGVHRDVWRSCF